MIVPEVAVVVDIILADQHHLAVAEVLLLLAAVDLLDLILQVHVVEVLLLRAVVDLLDLTLQAVAQVVLVRAALVQAHEVAVAQEVVVLVVLQEEDHVTNISC